MENKYFPSIGLEIHAELKTRTKMFCDSKNDSDERRPNVNICPVCMGHPGTLPTINKEAIKHILKVGMALGGKLADFTEFDRKNYFYPDIPKGYQISQYKYPLVTGGELNGVQLTRIHLEEDTATSKHDQGDFSLIDFNRAGVPLMELVTEPVIHSAIEASVFARELQLLLQYLGAAEANMEKGEMRVEANISISKLNFDKNRSLTSILGTKVEVKNLNSFRSVERAIDFEINRMAEMLDREEKVIQETRGWDEVKQKTFSQREKEESHDYRYFPEPDLPKLYISEVPEFQRQILEKEIPELPGGKRERYKRDFGLKESSVEIFIRDQQMAKFFEEVSSILKEKTKVALAANYITSDLIGLMKEEEGSGGEIFGRLTAENFAELIQMLSARELSSRAAKDILSQMYFDGGNPRQIAEEKNLLQKFDSKKLEDLVKNIAAAHPQVISDYNSGKNSALQYLIGQAMKETHGAANPEEIKRLLLSVIK